MARPAKTFDCLEMKRAIQEQLYRSWKGLSSLEIVATIQKDLAASDDPLVVKWRSIHTGAAHHSNNAAKGWVSGKGEKAENAPIKAQESPVGRFPEMGDTMTWQRINPGEYASADRLWTILHVAYGWSVTSAALQWGSVERTLAAAKEYAGEHDRPFRLPEPDETRYQPLPNTADRCDYCQAPLGANRYDISPFTGTRTVVRAWCQECYERLRRSR